LKGDPFCNDEEGMPCVISGVLKPVLEENPG